MYFSPRVETILSKVWFIKEKKTKNPVCAKHLQEAQDLISRTPHRKASVCSKPEKV